MLTGFKTLVRKATSLFTSPAIQSYPIIIPRNNHSLSRKNLSPNAVKVLYRLNKAGYDAYLVGGCIRDHLIGAKTKDFDVVTNATPEEVHATFSNSRLIGRRFRLVHVTFGREIIEVSTFRANSAQEDSDEVHKGQGSLKGKDSARSTHGMLLRDNVYGSIEEDAERRDFTFNALYYNVQDFSIHDYCGGLKDIENKVIRIIGDPKKRYKEDPVRMLRAIRFAGKLGFEIDPVTAAPIKEMAHLLDHIPPARLFEEVLKLMGSGNGITTFELLREYGLFRYLFPDTEALLKSGGNVTISIQPHLSCKGLETQINAFKVDKQPHLISCTRFYFGRVLLCVMKSFLPKACQQHQHYTKRQAWCSTTKSRPLRFLVDSLRQCVKFGTCNSVFLNATANALSYY